MSDRFIRVAARVVLISYLTQLFSPIVHACELDTLPVMGLELDPSHMRDASPRTERHIQEPFQQVLKSQLHQEKSVKTPPFSGWKTIATPSQQVQTKAVELIESFHQAPGLGSPFQAQADTYQYCLHTQTSNLIQENFQFNLLRKTKGSSTPFERLHTTTLSQGKLKATSYKGGEDALLSLFKGASVRKRIDADKVVCFSWQIDGIATINILQDGSIILNQDEDAPILSSYDLILKSSSNLIINNLCVSSLSLMSPKGDEHAHWTRLGMVTTNHLHTDHEVFNMVGLNVHQTLTGSGKLVNHGILKLQGTADKPAILGIQDIENRKLKGLSVTPQIEASHLRITENNKTFLNRKNAEFSVTESLVVDASPTASPLMNHGKIKLKQATLSREARNYATWQAHQMTVNEKIFSNMGFGNLNVFDQLILNSHLLNEGDMSVKNVLRLKTALNKGSIKGDELKLEVGEEMTNEGRVFVQALSGKGVFKNHGELQFQGLTSDISVRELVNQTTRKDKRATISGQRLFFSENKTFINDGNSNVDVNCLWLHGDKTNHYSQSDGDATAKLFASIINKGNIKASYISTDRNYLQNLGIIETAHLGPTQSLVENGGTINLLSMIIKGGKVHNLTEGKLNAVRSYSPYIHLIEGDIQNEGELISPKIQIDGMSSITNQGTTQTHKILGSGAFKNKGELQLTGSEKDPSKIGIKTFEQVSASKKYSPHQPPAPKTQGAHIIVTPENEQFVIECNSNLLAESLRFTPLPKGTPKEHPTTESFINRGEIRVNHLDIHRPRSLNVGLIQALTFGVHGGEFNNTRTNKFHSGSLTVENGIEADVQKLRNQGEIISRGKYLQSHGLLDNLGRWEHTGDINLGSSKLKNRGTMIWKHGRWDFIPVPPPQRALWGDYKTYPTALPAFENHGNWQLDQMECPQHLNIQNHGLLHLKDGSLDFGDLTNHKDLEVSGGHYRFFGNFINHNVMRLTNHNWTFTEGTNNKANLHIGEIECEKSYTHDAQAMPKAIRAGGDVTFTKRFQHRRTVADLLKITTPTGWVTFYCPSIMTDQDYEFYNIGHLDLYVERWFITRHSFKTRGLSLEVNGPLSCGASNTVMGTIAATDGPLTVTAHNIVNTFGMIYGKGPTKVTATQGDIACGSSIERPYDITKRLGYTCEYTQVVGWKGAYTTVSDVNGAYIASDSKLDLKARSLLLSYGQTYSAGDATFTADERIEAIRSIIQGNGKARWKAAKGIHFGRAPAVSICIGWMSDYYPCEYGWAAKSDQSEVHFGDSIWFDTSELKITASTISSKKGIYLLFNGQNFDLVKSPTQPPSLLMENYAWKYAYTFFPKFIAGESIQINTGDLVITGNMNAPVIAVQATGTGLFHNPSRSRNTVASAPIFIDFTDFVQKKADQKGFLTLMPDGAVKTAFSFGTPQAFEERQKLMLVDISHPNVFPQRMDCKVRFFDPLGSLSSGMWDLLIQQALLEHAGKVYVDGGQGINLIKKLCQNTEAWGKENQRDVITTEQIKNATTAMLLHKLQLVNNMIQQQTFLSIPAIEINPYQSSGDISCHEGYFETGGNQEHLNNRIVGKHKLKFKSRRDFTRKTEKYIVSSTRRDTTTIQEIGMPQQQMICEEGDVVSQIKGNYLCEATNTQAGRDILDTVQGSLTLKEQILNSTTTHTEEDEGMFSSSSTTETNSSNAILPNTRVAGRHISSETRDGIHLRAAKETAGQSITYEGPSLTSEAAIAVDTYSKTTEKNSMGSQTQTDLMTQSATVSSTEINAPVHNYNVKKATLTGTDFIALILNDNTNTGIKYGPTLETLRYRQQMITESSLAKTDIGSEGWYEVMQPCRFAVNQIIRKIDDGEMTFDSVDWTGKRPEIIGKFAETTYQLKQWQTEWAIREQVIPDEALVVVALGVAFATQGVGASWTQGLLTSTFGTVPTITTAGIIAMIPAITLTATGAAMASAGLTALCTQAATSFLKTGDPIATAKSVFSPEGLKSIGLSVASAGICQQLSSAFKIDLNPSLKELGTNPVKPVFTDFLKSQALKCGVNAGLNVALNGTDPSEAFADALKQAPIAAAAAWASYTIGDLGFQGTLTPLEQDMVHAIVGVAYGAVLNPDKPLEGALAGSANAVIAAHGSRTLLGNREEIREQANQLCDERGWSRSEANIQLVCNEIIHLKTAIPTLIGASLTAAVTKDPSLTSIAISVATNVTENNCVPSLFKSLVSGQSPDTGFWQDEFDDPRDVYIEILREEERVRTTRALIDPETYNPVQAAHESNIDEFVQDRLAYDELKMGKNLTPKIRERLIQQYSKAYYALRQMEAHKEFVSPGYHRLAQLASLSFEELKAMRIKEMDPNGSFSTKQRSNAERIIRNEFEMVKGKSFDLAIGSALTVAGGKTVYSAFNRNRAIAVNRNNPNSSKSNRTVEGLDLAKVGEIQVVPSLLKSRPTNSFYYSSLFQARLKPGAHFPGKSERLHFQESNKQLYNFLESNPPIRIEFDKAYPGLFESIKPSHRGIFPSRPPIDQGLTWHHNTHTSGLMELIPRSHHQGRGVVQQNLHPNKKGGMEQWGGGYSKRKINRPNKMEDKV